MDQSMQNNVELSEKEVSAILAEASALDDLADNEKAFVHSVLRMWFRFRTLSVLLYSSRKQTVDEWIRRLDHIPVAIGLPDKFSPDAQRKIEYVRNSIEECLDEKWPTESALYSSNLEDSGIDLLSVDDSGISLSSLETED